MIEQEGEGQEQWATKAKEKGGYTPFIAAHHSLSPPTPVLAVATPSESPYPSTSIHVPCDWPSQGRIEVRLTLPFLHQKNSSMMHISDVEPLSCS